MILNLIRKYNSQGTNGELFDGDAHLCFTIELPWNENQKKNSCIPEGKYQIVKRYSKERKWHLAILHVPDRSGILIHPANNAIKELEGCIAPVSFLEGAGKGSHSRAATERLFDYVTDKMKSELVFIKISSKK